MTKRSYRALTAIALTLLVALIVAACGGAAQPPPTATPVPTQVPTTGPTDLWQTIQQNGRIVVGVSADYPPFEFYDSDFRLDGFDIALMDEIGKKLGVDVEFNDLAFDGLGGALTLGQIDAAISAISVTPTRRSRSTSATSITSARARRWPAVRGKKARSPPRRSLATCALAFRAAPSTSRSHKMSWSIRVSCRRPTCTSIPTSHKP